MKKGKLKAFAYILLVLSGVFFYLYYSDGLYAIDSKYKNEAIRDLTVTNTENPLDRRIDFDKLKGMNEDVVAWVYIPGTTVDYPILIGSEDETYLYSDIEKKYNPLGSIFSFANAKLDDGHVMLFGHNMRKFQMFGEIRKFLNNDYMSEHRKFYIYTPSKAMEFDIISIFDCDENDDFFTVGRELGTSEFVEFVSDIINRNVYSDYKVGGSSFSMADSQIYSLVTCNGLEGTSRRLVVNGVVTKEKYYIN